MSAISLASVRRQLPPGTEFEAEFLGTFNSSRPDDERLTRRRVVSQTSHKMVSTILTGPKAGRPIDCQWSHVRATHEDGRILLWINEAPQHSHNGEAFVAFRLIATA